MEPNDYITTSKDICGGRACVKGTRITVASVLANLADGRTEKEIIAEYPPVTYQDIPTCMAFAAEMVNDGFIDIAQTAQ